MDVRTQWEALRVRLTVNWVTKWILKAALHPAIVATFRDASSSSFPLFPQQQQKSGLAVSSVCWGRVVGDRSFL